MNFLFWFILSIDFLLMILHYLYSIEMIKKHQIFYKMKDRNQKLNENMDERVPNSTIGKFIFGILTITTVLLMLAFLTSILWLPITIWLIIDWQSAIIAFLLVSAVFSLLMIYIYVKFVPGYVIKEGAIVKEAIYVSFFILLSIFIRYGTPFPLENTVERVYLESGGFNSTLSVLIPVLVIGLLITNLYLFINGLAYIVDKSKQIVKARTKIIDILTIFAFSSFFALFFVVDRELSFLTSAYSTRYYETLDIFKNILVAVIIPLVLTRFINQDGKKSEVIQITKDETQLIKNNQLSDALTNDLDNKVVD